jgi:hypothetical protein
VRYPPARTHTCRVTESSASAIGYYQSLPVITLPPRLSSRLLLFLPSTSESVPPSRPPSDSSPEQSHAPDVISINSSSSSSPSSPPPPPLRRPHHPNDSLRKAVLPSLKCIALDKPPCSPTMLIFARSIMIYRRVWRATPCLKFPGGKGRLVS